MLTVLGVTTSNAQTKKATKTTKTTTTTVAKSTVNGAGMVFQI